MTPETVAANAPLDGDPAAIAVVMPTWLGDIVMATPALDRLRRAVPDARITAIVPPGMNVVLDGVDSVDAIRVVSGKGIAGPWRTAAAIRAAGRAAVILMPNSFRSAIAARLAGSRVRLGTPRDGRGPLLTHRVPVPTSDAPLPAVVLYDTLVAAALGREPIDLHGPDAEALRPRLATTPEERVSAATALGATRDVGRLVLVPGGNRNDKRWPIERFAEVARALRDRFGLQPVVSGSPGERTLCAALAGAIGPDCIDLAASGVSLGVVKGVIADARLVITNDTGPRHLAAGLGAPCVALFGPTDPRWTTLPGVDEDVLVGEPFLPAELTADRHAGLCRIDRIPASDVLFAAASRLRRDAPAAGVSHGSPTGHDA